MENEVRTDFIGNGAVITVGRGARPHDVKKGFSRAEKTADPAKCFFCPGNEHLTPPEIDRVPGGRGWSLRVFENKFPAFARNFERAYGRHEIIVETPDHGADFSSLSPEAYEEYLGMMRKRINAAYSDKLIEWVLPFKNEGLDAGASLEHSHSQLVAASFVPDYAKEKSALSTGKCKFCEFAKAEKHSLFEDSEWKVICPHASRFNYEIWVLPKKHVRSMCELGKSQRASLALVLRKTLLSLDRKVGRPPYNIIFNEAPRGMPFHMHIEILPRLARWAGFEFGARMNMNSVPPEDAARLLKF